MTAPVTVFEAREIVTMNPSNPTGRFVAVRDGLILGVAQALDDLSYWGDVRLDRRYADAVLTPGFVEAHGHASEGAFARVPYIGYFDRRMPDGSVAPGSRTIDEVVERLRAVDASIEDPEASLIAWGFDPIYFDGVPFGREELDRVSKTRPIFVMHASLHLASVNSAILTRQGITADTETEGVVKDETGEPTGELQELPAMMLAGAPIHETIARGASDDAWWDYGRSAVVAGVTTLTDLGANVLVDPSPLDATRRIVNDPAFPARLVTYAFPSMPGAQFDPSAAVSAFRTLKSQETAKWRLGGIKLVADGSIQGWTAVLNPPGYNDGSPGIWLVTPDQMIESVPVFHAAGINVHCHCNGDAIIDAFSDAVDLALRQTAWLDHRHTVQHCQLATSAQLRRMANLGMAANLFANHLWYWGDQHYERTVGPERANRMEPCASAKREGVRFALHSDCNVTPLGSLHLVWAAVNRRTPSGRVLGEFERISAYDALQAVTVDAAYQLHMDREIGSIEIGKRADFAVLAANPLTVDAMAIRDIEVFGTVVGGISFDAPTVSA